MQEAWDVVEGPQSAADLFAEYDRLSRHIDDLDAEIEMKYEHLRELKDEMRAIVRQLEQQGEMDWGTND